MEVGGWVQVSLGCWLLVVGYFDLSVLFMSVKGFQQKEVWMGAKMGVCGWGELYPIFFVFF